MIKYLHIKLLGRRKKYVKLCIFADIHYIDKIPNWPNKRKLVEYAECLTDKMIDKINNEINPDIVIHLGDLIQSSNDIEIDKKIYSIYGTNLKEYKSHIILL